MRSGPRPCLNLTALVALALLAAAVPAHAAKASGATPWINAHPPAGASSPPASIPPPAPAGGATLARIVAPTQGRRRLASTRRAVWLGTATQWSQQPQVLLVLGSAVRSGSQWVEVLLASRPNGSTAWVRRDAVRLSTTPYWVDIDIRARTVTVLRRGKRVRRFRAVVGAPPTPTPKLLAAVYEHNRQANPRGFLGPWALPLTAMSDVLDDYGGGPGRIAVHGRAGTSLADHLGTARSHGCIRIDNSPIRYLARTLPTGTPVSLH
jgi:lipoprotein-anchoring transpeptidase ErfK/SrfK